RPAGEVLLDRDENPLENGNTEGDLQAPLVKPPADSALWGPRSLVTHARNLPRWTHDPYPASALDGKRRGLRLRTLSEEGVDDRTGPGDIGAEGAERAQFGRQWGRRKVIRRQCSEVTDGERLEQTGTPLRIALGPVSGVEGRVDRRRRVLGRALGEEQQHRVPLRQVERRQPGALVLPELRAFGEEEGD